jgi:hypothetical protein
VASPKKPVPSSAVPDPVVASLACGCRLAFRPGVEGSPVTVVVAQKAPGCPTSIHVSGLPLYDHREALRPSTRPLPSVQSDWEEN